MAGRNLYGLTEALAKTASVTRPCVFISYNSDDRVAATSIAELCVTLDVNIWFDKRDVALQRADESGDKKGVVQAIDRGLASATHLLGILGPTTFRSWWVPYEIGGARATRKPAAHLILGGVTEVPDYVAVSTLVTDEALLRTWLATLSSADLKKATRELIEGFAKTGSRGTLGAHLPFERKPAPRIVRT